jgi:hypothetical protein
VQVHHDEGVANRIGPESCAVAREGIGEALTGGCIGLPSSRAVLTVRHALPTAFHCREVLAAGGLMSYGGDFNDSFRVTGVYAGRIFNGDCGRRLIPGF